MRPSKTRADGSPLGPKPVKGEDLKSVTEQMEDIHPDAWPWPTRGSAKADGGGLRYNAGKTLMELIPPEWEWALADVTTQGSKKYEKRNWERGMDWSIMVGCMKRHLTKFLVGERYDGEEFDVEAGTTGCHHLAMVAWNALALMSYDLRDIGNNDLPELPKELLAMVNAVSADVAEPTEEFHRTTMNESLINDEPFPPESRMVQTDPGRFEVIEAEEKEQMLERAVCATGIISDIDFNEPLTLETLAQLGRVRILTAEQTAEVDRILDQREPFPRDPESPSMDVV